MKIPALLSIIDGIQDIAGEFGKARNVGKSLKIKALVKIDDVNVVRYNALISESRKLVYVPMLNMLWMHPRVQRINGVEHVLCSAKNAYCLDWDRLQGISEAERYSAALSFQYQRKFCTLKVENVSGTFDMGVFDEKNTDMSRDFMHSSSSMMRSKTLTAVLDDLPQRQMMVYMAIAGFFGWGLGQVTVMVLYIVYMWWT